MKLRQLSREKLDTVAEFCNIGAGHAAGSLSKLVQNLPIRLTVPRVNVVSLQEVPDLIGGAERFVGAVHLEIQGEVQGSLVILFDEASSRSLISTLLKRKPEDIHFHEAIVISTLGEVGNIIASAFVGILSELTSFRLLPSTPLTAFDMAGAVLDEVLIELGKEGDEALFIEIHMEADQQKFNGQLFIVPDPHTLDHLILS